MRNMMKAQAKIDIASIRETHSIIQMHTYLTPVQECSRLDDLVQEAVFDHVDGCTNAPKLHILFKCENLQRSGSFKFRGAYNFLSKLSKRELRCGLVSYSTGEHVSLASLYLG
jgi:threonine dehydratase